MSMPGETVVTSTSPATAVPLSVPAVARLEREDAERALQVMSALVAITTRLFGPVVVLEDGDPESAGDRYVVLAVDVQEPSEEIARRHRQWVEAVGAIAPGLETVRLRIRAA